MPNSVTKVIYQPDHQSTDAYEIFVNPEELKKYKEDKSVPLVDVVSSYDVFFSSQGATGQLGKASKQQLETVFGTSKDVDVVEKIIELGKVQEGKKISASGFASTNDSRGGR
ncbi:ribosome maturation protein [Mrakia frigida]|uniref:Rtc3p n=1 Tax=Mrakia frigida TaxID=29902 RepID=UPI003FCBF38E